MENDFEFNLENLNDSDWSARLEEICEEQGHFEPLGPDFSALQLDGGASLLVSFETVPSIRQNNADHAPLGWLKMREHGWSSLTILANQSESWFRHPAIYGFFDRLIDDGYFDDFDQIVFFGAGGAAYAAAAYSVAAPDCRVLALRPQASLDPAVATWDRRHMDQRRHDFRTRFGYAPKMLETAEQAWVIYDPLEPIDAMHATLFGGANTTALKTPRLGPTLPDHLVEMGLRDPLLDGAMAGFLDAEEFAELWRARREHIPYLREILRGLLKRERNEAAEWLCHYTLQLGDDRFTRRRLVALQEKNAAPAAAED